MLLATGEMTETRARKSWRGVRLYTVGHSTRTIDELVALLRPFGIGTVVDVRTIPRSRHNPQFEREALRAALRRRHLGYVHLPALGGLRRARDDSVAPRERRPEGARSRRGV